MGATTAERPKAKPMATIAAPRMEPIAIPETCSADAATPTARLSGSKPMKITLSRKAERPKPMDVPITPLTSCSAKKMTSPRPRPPKSLAPAA
jgi:hypothetical protein